MSARAGLRTHIRTHIEDALFRAPELSPWKCFEQKLELTNEKPPCGPSPQYHIVCTSTLATRDPGLVAKARAEDRLWDIDTGHDLMITEPQAVAELLLPLPDDRRADAAG